MALDRRDAQGGGANGGGGQMIDLALYEAPFRITADMMTKHARTGDNRERIGNRNPTFAPAGTFLTPDGRYVPSAPGGDKVVARRVKAMDKPQPAAHPHHARHPPP